jgi:hypothetical protein
MVASRQMPRPSKPCDGKLSPETQELLSGSRDREKWGVHHCEVCGQAVGVQEIGGLWLPERHWPSVVYAPRGKGGRAIKPTGGEMKG